MKQSIVTVVKEKHRQLDILESNESFKEMYEVLVELGKIARTEKYFTTLSTLQFTEGRIESALQTVNEGIQHFTYSYSLNLNAALIHFTAGSYERTFYHFGKCLRFASEKENKDDIFEKCRCNF